MAIDGSILYPIGDGSRSPFLGLERRNIVTNVGLSVIGESYDIDTEFPCCWH